MKNIIKFVIASFFIFILGIFYLALNSNSNYDTKHLVGSKLTNVKLESFDKEKFFTSDDLSKSNYTLINFWASWCSPCRIEHEHLMELSKQSNLKILGVNFKDKKINAIKFLKDLGNPYDFLTKDELGKQSVNFGIYGIPESILIDNDLKILIKFVGPLSKEDINNILNIIKTS